MKPRIGITVNCTIEPNQTIHKGLALPDQTIQYVADDYVKVVVQAGGAPVLLPITSDIECLDSIIDMLDGIIFTGGSDIDPCFYGEERSEHLGLVNHIRDAHEIALAKKILEQTQLPYLGICRGSQLLNVVCEGSLYQDLQTDKKEVEEHSYFERSPKHNPIHKVSIKESSKLQHIIQRNELDINSFHHQAVKKLGKDLEVIATAPDGTVEAIERTGERFVLAVQWHPEMMAEHDPHSQNLFKHFIKICSNNRKTCC